MDTEWMARGNCAHESPRMFFPSDRERRRILKRRRLAKLATLGN